MKRLAIGFLVFAGVLGAQVAQQANSTYRTEAERKAVARVWRRPLASRRRSPAN